ncbi:helix-turn-helix domain-containing protein [Asaia prunellae]|uniref:helix-turn-helix domain-containing protein n=1 Tax=Asaia prunellae TaxID=610245 RepID=UPI0011DCDF53|nr:helix-turn-helix domain-containing protein [Asaia prunellae]
MLSIDRAAARAGIKQRFRQLVLKRLYGRELTHAQASVLMRLATFLGRDGLYPSHATIATAAGVSARTVIRALDKAYSMGLVTRRLRRIRCAGRVLRTSNAYTLNVRPEAVASASSVHLARAVFSRCKVLSDSLTQKARKISKEDNKSVKASEGHRSVDEYLRIIASWV